MLFFFNQGDSMNWYFQGLEHIQTRALHLLSEDTALGKDPNFPCPLAIPRAIQDLLVVLRVLYLGFDGVIHVGQVVVHRNIAARVEMIFAVLLWMRFPLQSVIPIAAFQWDDKRSMAANNTSAFNYRYKDKPGIPELSEHALGLAIDFNPWINPCVRNGIITPQGAHYHPNRLGTIVSDSWIIKLFRISGADWGGHWQSLFDPQHIEFKLS